MTPLLTVQNLRTYFFTSAGIVKSVDGVSFSIRPGGRLGIVGESGCGKSITALSLLRLVSPPGKIIDGRILLSGVDLLGLPESEMQKIRGSKIAMIFQEPMTSLNPLFTVSYQIEEAVILHQKMSKKERREYILELLKLVGISDPDRVARAYPHELSGGMRQRIMIAMALSCRPSLLIADEPTTALDVTIQAQVLSLLMELHDKFHMAFILITHDLGVIAETVDEVAVMYAGKIVEQASTQELFSRPAHPYTKALLKALPSVQGEANRLGTIPGTVPDLACLPRGCAFQSRCERVQKKCVEEDPLLNSCGPNHQVRCFYPYE